MIYTTLNAIRAHHPCKDGWGQLLRYLGKTEADDEPLVFVTILDSNGLDDALWCLRAVPEHSALWLMYAVWCVRKVQHLITGQECLDALDVAERHDLGAATDDELAAALDAVRSSRATAELRAAGAARAAWTAAAVRAAAWAAGDAAGADVQELQTQKLREILLTGQWVED